MSLEYIDHRTEWFIGREAELRMKDVISTVALCSDMLASGQIDVLGGDLTIPIMPKKHERTELRTMSASHLTLVTDRILDGLYDDETTPDWEGKSKKCEIEIEKGVTTTFWSFRLRGKEWFVVEDRTSNQTSAHKARTSARILPTMPATYKEAIRAEFTPIPAAKTLAPLDLDFKLPRSKPRTFRRLD